MSKHKKQTTQITIQNPDAAGIDIGSRKHYVAIPTGRDDKSVRSFGVFTKDLNEMANWLVECGITTVAMESTGVYWIPVFQILEDYGLQTILVNASHIKNVPGRKTDVSDCQWIQQLHSFGLLRGSFRPETDVATYRSFVRQRDKLIKGASDHVRRMQKSLELMNLHLHKVINDITGKTGMKIIKAIVQGERDPNTLAKMKDHRIRNSVETIRLALEGDWRDEHLFVLKQEYDLYIYYRNKIKQCDEQIEACLFRLHQGDPSDMPKPSQKKKTKKRLRL